MRRASIHWTSLLADPRAPAQIAAEASELAGLARARSLGEIGDLLKRVHDAAGSGQLGVAVGDLLRRLDAYVAGLPLAQTMVIKPPVVMPGAPAALAAPALSRAPERRGAPAPGGPPGGDVPLPPLLDRTGRDQAAPMTPPLPLPLDKSAVLPAAGRPPQPSEPPVRAPVPRSPLPEALAKAAQPQLIVKNMLGFRAFQRDPHDGAPRREEAPPARVPDRAAAAAAPGLLGLGSRARTPPSPAPVTPPRASVRVDREERTGPRKGQGPRLRDPRARVVPAWAYLVGGALTAAALATVGAVVFAGHMPVARPTPSPGGSGGSSGPGGAGLSPAGASPSSLETHAGPSKAASAELQGQVAHLAETVHEQGPETPELRALMDVESRIAANCREDPSVCARGWAKRSREVLESPAAPVAVAPPPTEGPPSAWLLRLKLPPDCPVRDEPSLRGVFDYESKNISGRQHFQAKVFDCAAYADIFESTLVKYGAPTWLTAVVFQESGCDPRATSEVGAKGLWQFMPDAGRAYGLRVVEDDVDERLNPIKSTDAGVHFLTDLKRKLGAWDLALAAYNMGPFGVATRIAQVGGHATFWDLSHAGLLPEETAAYVPAIEAHALILANLGRLQFSNDGKHLESTAEIMVKPGTRLSLIARAAATSTLRIRQLNPEFLRDVVPDGEASARVPDAEAHRAQTFLETRSPDDDKDLCVPEDFDWGVKPFESSKYAATCARTAPAATP